MAMTRVLAFAVVAGLVAGCGGIVDVVNEYDDGTSSTSDGGRSNEGGSSDASVVDGATIAWGAESGTRLKAIWWKTEDGARSFAGWHDDELGQDCTFIHATDGVDRCVPPAPYIQGYGPPSLFEDAACTIPLVFAPRATVSNACALTDPMPGGLYATLVYSAPTGGGSCGFAFEVHSLSPTSGLSHVYSGAGCAQQDADPTLSYYEYGAAIPPSTFVGSKTAIEPASTRLTFLTRTNDDGGRERLSLYDQSLGVTCGATQAADDTIRCLPDTTGEVGIFADANCTTPLEHCDHSTSCDQDLCGNPVPFAAAVDQVGGCDQRFHIYPVTGTVPEGTPVYERTGSACDPSDVLRDQLGGYVGAEIDPSKFVALESSFLNVETRLRRYVWDPNGQGPIGVTTRPYAAGHGYVDIGWRDGARVEDCAITPTVDDQLRCVPAAALAQAFSDDTCADAPLVRLGTNAGCAGVARYVTTRPVLSDACARERVFEVGPTVLTDQTSEYALMAGIDGGAETTTCTSFTPQAGTDYVVVGADVTSQFVGFSRVIE